MKPEDVRQLLGGYATGTLTPEEQKALFDAALQDQDLFEALAQEQSLKEALDQPGVRSELAEVLETRRWWGERLGAWMRWPYPVAAAAALATAAITALVIWRSPTPHPEIAQSRPQVIDYNLRSTETTVPQAISKEPARIQRELAPRLMLKKSLDRTAVPPTSAANSSAVAAPPAPILEPPAAELKMAPQIAAGRLAMTELPRSPQARELFNGFVPQRSPAPGIAGSGVVGGYPTEAIRGARAKAMVTDSAVAVNSPLGVRYSIRDAQGSPPQLVVESNSDGVLYIFRRNEVGQWLPVMTGGISLKARTPATTPPITIEGTAAFPRAVLVLSRTPLTELAQTGVELSATVERLRTQNESVPLMTEVTGGSTYVVIPRQAAIIVTPLDIP